MKDLENLVFMRIQKDSKLNKNKITYLILGTVIIISVIFALDNVWNNNDTQDNAVWQSIFSPDPSIKVDTILETNQTIIGQPLLGYLKESGTPQITTKVITIPKGADTGIHSHGEILIGYILKGEITISYWEDDGSSQKMTFSKGDSLVEAIGVEHLGENTGNVDVKILVVTLNNSVSVQEDGMIVISYEIFLAEGETIDRFSEAFRVMDEETRKEEGCLMYVSTVDVNDPTVIRIFEVWESRELLKPHFQTDHIKNFQQTLNDLQVKSVNAKAYEADKEIPFESLR